MIVCDVVHILQHFGFCYNGAVPRLQSSRDLVTRKRVSPLDTYGHLIHKMQDGAAKMIDDLVTPIKVDLRELGTQDVETGNKKARNHE